jgi:hypothetical protein
MQYLAREEQGVVGADRDRLDALRRELEVGMCAGMCVCVCLGGGGGAWVCVHAGACVRVRVSWCV